TVAVDRRGSVAKDGDKGGAALAKQLDALAAELKALGKKDDSPISFAADAAKAAWLVRAHRGAVYLLRAAEGQDDRPEKERAWGGPGKGRAGGWLTTSLKKIARAENLKALASQPLDEAVREADAKVPRVEVVIARAGAKKRGGKPAGEQVFYAGDEVDIH